MLAATAAALRYEWVRLTTIRSTYWLLGVTVVVYLVLSWVIAQQVAESAVASLVDQRQTLAAVLTVGASGGFAPLLLAYVLGIVGVFAMGHEYRHQTIKATLTAVPNRYALVVAKLAVTGLAAAVGALLAMLAAMLGTVAVGLDVPLLSAFTGKLVLGVVVYAVLFTWVGVALAGLIRHQTGAVALLILLPTVVESILRALLRIRQLLSGNPGEPDAIAQLAKYLPFDAGGKMYTRASIADLVNARGTEPLGAVAGGVTMGIFVALLVAAMTYLFVRRDA